MGKQRSLIVMILLLAVAAIPWGVNVAHAGPGGHDLPPRHHLPRGSRVRHVLRQQPGRFQDRSFGDVLDRNRLRKFVDSLPGLGSANANNLGQYIPVANPDTTTYPGSDYYVIGLQDYTEKLHSDLPKATKLRGYYQINTTERRVHDHANKYLGPLSPRHAAGKTGAHPVSEQSSAVGSDGQQPLHSGGHHGHGGRDGSP